MLEVSFVMSLYMALHYRMFPSVPKQGGFVQLSSIDIVMGYYLYKLNFDALKFSFQSHLETFL